MTSWHRRLLDWLLGRPGRATDDLSKTDPAMTDDALAGAAELLPRGAPWAMGCTHRGKVRENNEDDFLCAPERRLFIVCDGMGGHAAGEVASREAIDILDAVLSREAIEQALAADGDGIEALLRQGLRRANERVFTRGSEDPAWSGMASAAVICLLHPAAVHLANLGDCRAYRLRGEDVRLLTTDHSVAAALVTQGKLTAEEARSHPLRNHLTASLGLAQPSDPACSSVEVQPEDRLVICSDGLWDMLSDAAIARLATSHPPEEAVKALIRAANAAGGADNITVIVVHVGAEDGPAETETVETAAEPEAQSPGAPPAE